MNTTDLKLKKKKIKIIKETAKIYNSENRCINVIKAPGSNAATIKCLYFKENHIGCAVGRLIKDKELCKKLDSFEPKNGVTDNLVWNNLPQDLKDLGQEFLHLLQDLHDTCWYWNEKGLTIQGKEQVDFIIQEINNGKI